MLSYRVLIVDDQLLQREYLKSLFIQAGIAQVDTAENGCHALSLLEQQRYDLVLSDLLMPELDGVQLIQRLSTYEAPPLLAVISSSPKRLISGASLVAKTLGMRVIDQLSKPAQPQAIIALVAAEGSLAAEGRVAGVGPGVRSFRVAACAGLGRGARLVPAEDAHRRRLGEGGGGAGALGVARWQRAAAWPVPASPDTGRAGR